MKPLIALLALSACGGTYTPVCERPEPHRYSCEQREGTDYTPRGERPTPEPEPGPEQPDREPNRETDPEGHRDWQRDRDAQQEEGTW